MNKTKIDSNQDKCQTCGGILRFSPDDGALKCGSCSSIEKIDYSKNVKKHDYGVQEQTTKEYNEFVKQNKVFKCYSCGSNIVLNTLEVSKVCPYCSSPCVIDENEKIGIKPDGIIPFKFGREKARDLYKKGIRKKWFIPNIFKKKPPIDEMKGVYVPTFSFDAKAFTKYSGRLGTQRTNSQGETHTSYKTISGTYNSQHSNVLVETSTKLDQATFNSINPFNMADVVNFNSAFILGYSLEHYNQKLEHCKTIADDMIKDRIKKLILSKYSYDFIDYFNQDTVFSQEKYSYYIVPTYQVNYKYKNKNYTTFMNGQTGKVGSGYPKSAIKITFFVLFILAIFTAIAIAFFAL